MLISGINAQTSDILPELSRFRTNKTLPAIIEQNVLMALSFYPELTGTTINFVFKQAIKSSVMQAQPVLSSLLDSREKRAYRINISALFKLTHTAIPIHQLPDAIMIGWIGHELGHILDYESRPNLELVGFGLGYIFSAEYVCC